MTPAITGRQTAAAIGLSWERFRKVWRTLPAFPPPILRPGPLGRGRYAWRPESVEAWIAGRTRALGPASVVPDYVTANDPGPLRPPPVNTLQRQRADILRRMGASS